eukprot:jgi/Botrbrau1/16922/Bobra.13_1s0001.1
MVGARADPQEINHPQPLGPTPAAPQSNCPNLNSAPVNQLPLGVPPILDPNVQQYINLFGWQGLQAFRDMMASSDQTKLRKP